MVDLGPIILMFQIVAIVTVSWLVSEILIRVIARTAKRARASPGLLRSIREGLTVLWIALAAVGLLSFTGIASEFSFLTLSGIVGLAVSLALQNTLSNIISGVLILSDGVLRLNDSFEYSGVRGTIVKIGLRATWIKTDQADIAINSNNYLANGPLVSYTATQRLERKLQVLFRPSEGLLISSLLHNHKIDEPTANRDSPCGRSLAWSRTSH